MSKVYITRGDGLRARRQPTTDATIVGDFPAGSRLAVDHNVTVGSDIWHALQVTAGEFPLRDASNSTYPAYLFAAHRYRGTDYTDAEVVEPPVSTRGRYRIGVNGLANFHEMERAFELGCRYGIVVNDFAFASKLMDRFPDAFVMVRRTPFNLDPNSYLHQMEGIGDPRLIYTGMNEGDEIGYTGSALRERCRLSVNYWNQCRAKGARHAGLTFSMGTPVIESAEDMQIIHDECAEAFAQGMFLDYHGYSPTPEHPDPKNASDWKWYEHRMREVIKRARLDPIKTRVTLSEGHLYSGGGGGLLWAVKYGKMLRSNIPVFLEQRRALYELPMAIDGVEYPAPEIGEAGFQMGRNEPEGQPGWGGYALGGYMDILPPVWRVV